MQRLGYEHYFAQGGDWGSAITHSIAMTETRHCVGAHVNMALVSPSDTLLNNLSELEQKALASTQHYVDWDSGYSKEQSTRPQTVGYGLVDSPRGIGRAGSSRNFGLGQITTDTLKMQLTEMRYWTTSCFIG